MNRAYWWCSVVVLLSALAGCNTDGGGCWLPSEQGSGAGGAPVTLPTGGFGDSPTPKPQDASDPAPCGEQRYANCKIVGAAPQFDKWSGFVDSLPEAATRCQSYANTHGGGTCSEANCTWEPEAGTAAKWTCSGPVNGCTGCKDKDCSFTGNCASATGSGSTESKAKRDALDDCQAQLDNQAPGLWWECKNDSGLTCSK